MLGKKLPNGWEIALSDGQIVSAKRISYEGEGVPVDVEVVHPFRIGAPKRSLRDRHS